MSVGLLDVNVLFALVWHTHLHHDAAHEWFRANSSQGWATCPITECGFVRISSNPKVLRDAVEPGDAWATLRGMVSQKDHVFWPADMPFDDNDVPVGNVVTHRQITDAYLLGLAIRHNGKLVTLDRGIAGLLPPGSPHRNALEIVTAA